MTYAEHLIEGLKTIRDPSPRVVAAGVQQSPAGIDFHEQVRLCWIAMIDETIQEIRLARIATLYDAIAHGSEEHRAWLKQAIEDHFAGRLVEKPRG